MADDTGMAGPPPKVLSARQKSVNQIFNRVGQKIRIHRSVPTGVENEYGKEEESSFIVGEELAVLWNPGSGQGGARPSRKEERYGERVGWEPGILLQGDSEAQEKDTIEYGLTRYPRNQGGGSQLWELETIVPYHTHLEGQLQRYVEQG